MKRTSFFLLVGILIFSHFSQAFLVEENSNLVNDTAVNFVPSYFFKPDPTGKYISYTSTKDALFISNLESKKQVQVFGSFDPIFFPLPHQKNQLIATSENGISFFNFKNVQESEIDTKKIYNFTNPGIYQSIGILEKKSEKAFRFRMIYQVDYQDTTNNFNYDDFDYKMVNNKETITRVTSESKPVCKNYYISMAMISKNGKEVVAYNLVNKKSQVFEIGADNNCTIKEDLGLIAGKAAFSYDNQFIAYHSLSEFVYDKSGYVNIPGSEVVGNIFIYSRKTKKHYPLTKFSVGTAMYPEFLENGDVIFVYYDSSKGGNTEARFIRVKPNLPEKTVGKQK